MIPTSACTTLLLPETSSRDLSMVHDEGFSQSTLQQICKGTTDQRRSISALEKAGVTERALEGARIRHAWRQNDATSAHAIWKLPCRSPSRQRAKKPQVIADI